jgi:hypothetical protein
MAVVRKRIPLVTRADPAYAASLSQHDTRPSDMAVPPLYTTLAIDTEVPRDAPPSGPQRSSANPVPANDTSIQVDVRVTALARQEMALLGCGIAPAQVIRASMRRVVKHWQLTPDYVAPALDRRASDRAWTARTSVAVPAAIFDRIQAEQDPLGVCGRWSLVRGQLEPLIWEEIDALLATFESEADEG